MPAVPDGRPAPGPGLRRAVHEVHAAALGARTRYAGGRLEVAAAEAEALLAAPALASVRVSWVHPGESARIVKVLDAVEPRTRGPGGGGIFPGFLGPALPQGGGEVRVLRGAAVVAAGHLPRAQEALVDMSGPAAALSPLAATHNLVVEFAPSEGAPWDEVDRALRAGCLRLAARLAEAAWGAEPDSVEELPEVHGAGDGLPRVGVITNLQTQGAFKDVFLYGRTMAGSLPTAIDPNELEAGAVVSGQYGHPALRNPTCLHQNHPVVAALRARDGVDLSFAGLILCPEPVDQAGKELVSAHAARLARFLGFDAAVVTKEGGGNADADVTLKMDLLEDAGVTAVGVLAEMAGRDGDGPPLVVPPRRAAAMVSTGNYDERLRLPAVETAVGGERFDLLGVDPAAELEVPAAVVVAALSPLGWGRLTAAPEPEAVAP